MLTPSDITALANDITDIFSEVEAECISSIVKRLTAGRIVSETAVWQMGKLSEVGKLSKELVRNISKIMPHTEQQVMRLLEISLRRSRNHDAKKVANSLKGDMLDLDGVQATEGFQRVLASASAGVHTILNMTGTTALQASLRTYTDAVNKAYLATVTGNMTLPDAVRKATGAIGRSGIKVVDSVDKVTDAELVNTKGEFQTTYQAPKSVRTYPLDSAIRRDIVTTINKACGELTLADADIAGTPLIETSWHIGARPEHEEWQGRIFSTDPNDTEYDYFFSACRYNEVDGICGINCRHSFSFYFRGQPRVLENKPSAEENNRIYELSQKQRNMERTLRAYKREQVAYREGGYTSEAQKTQSRINEYSAKYRQFLEDNDLKRDTMRERVEGYRSIGTK